MNVGAAFAIELMHGSAGAAAARGVRTAVFIREQGIPAALAWDAWDAQAWHALARAADGEVVGTARLLPSGQIGRMAVQAGWRRRGVGTALLQALLAQADAAGVGSVFLHAQCSAVPFYVRHGFAPRGEPFTEAGIEHRHMTRRPCRRQGD